MIRLTLAIIVLLQLLGCATTPPVIDLSDSAYTVKLENGAALKSIGALKIIDKADDGKLVNTILGSDTIFPIKPAVTTKETVEQDLQRFFDSALRVNNGVGPDLMVTISKADAYWIWGGAAKIPIFGLFLVNADTEFGINLRILFEVEQNGEVSRSYLFDDKITIQGKAGTQKDVITSYQKLVAEYRKRLFGELEANFVSRYL